MSAEIEEATKQAGEIAEETSKQIEEATEELSGMQRTLTKCISVSSLGNKLFLSWHKLILTVMCRYSVGFLYLLFVIWGGLIIVSVCVCAYACGWCIITAEAEEASEQIQELITEAEKVADATTEKATKAGEEIAEEATKAAEEIQGELKEVTGMCLIFDDVSTNDSAWFIMRHDVSVVSLIPNVVHSDFPHRANQWRYG